MFYAHSTERSDRRDWQSLAEHLHAVGDMAGQRAERFDCGALARVLGLLHDLGKYTPEFQKRLAGDATPVDHSTAGAKIAREVYGTNLGQLFAYALAGHHAGLANGRGSGGRRPLSERLAAAIYPLDPSWRNEIVLPDVAIPSLTPKRERAFFQYAFLCRMLFSCLVDADFIETERFYARVNNLSCSRGKHPILPDLRDALDTYLEGLDTERPVNSQRRDILSHVRNRATLDPGHFSLTVPTGGGKTLTSLAFALDHAITHGMDRVIYVIPFTSIVEQNAAVFRKALGPYGASAVLEHHGSFDAGSVEGLADAKSELWSKLKRDSENWDAPVVVTTAVQFFESLFAAKTSRCRKLHNIANSVIILDEAQTIPLSLLRPSLAAIDELRLNYRSSLIYCTATQPALADTHSGALPEALSNVRELAPSPADLFNQFKRVKVAHIGLQSDESIVDRLTQTEQILCIVNNRRHARYLFDQIAKYEGARHLTTAMYANHRREVLADIRRRLTEGLPCRVIATSLIEAGVDIDFPSVLRAEAGLDAIAQAAGRCNREGNRALAESQVEVFGTASEDWSPPPELKAFAQTMGEILRQNPEADPLSPEIMQRYFDMLYWQQGDDGLDRRAIMKTLQHASIDGLPFEQIEADYRLIENNQRAVIIPHGDAIEAIRALEYAEHVGGLARRLRPYTVQVPQPGFRALEKFGAVTTIRPEEFGDEFVVLVNTDLYSAQSGLNWNDPTFIKAESLTW